MVKHNICTTDRHYISKTLETWLFKFTLCLKKMLQKSQDTGLEHYIITETYWIHLKKKIYSVFLS